MRHEFDWIDLGKDAIGRPVQLNSKNGKLRTISGSYVEIIKGKDKENGTNGMDVPSRRRKL